MRRLFATESFLGSTESAVEHTGWIDDRNCFQHPQLHIIRIGAVGPCEVQQLLLSATLTVGSTSVNLVEKVLSLVIRKQITATELGPASYSFKEYQQVPGDSEP
jgi:hypothetical protein